MTVRMALLLGVAVVVAAAPMPAQAAPVSAANLVLSHVYPDSTEPGWTDVRIRMGALMGPTRVTLQRGDQVVGQATARSSGEVVVFGAESLPSGSYTVRVGEGSSASTLRVSIHRGWAPLAEDRPTWKRCRTVAWRYDASRAPNGGARGIVKDVSAVFSSFAAATGLRFVRVRTGGAFTVRWGDTGGADGVGGLEWTSGPGSVSRGFVTLSARSQWAKTPGPLGRQVLLLHETAHALGMGHVDVSRALMSPTYVPGTTRPVLGAGELRGLGLLYRPASCR